MKYTIRYTFKGLPNGGEATVEVEDVKSLFEIGHALQGMPTACPFDGANTRLYFARDDKGRPYYYVCSLSDENLRFKFGQRESAEKELYPYGWTLFEYRGDLKFTWHWKQSEWFLYEQMGDKKQVNYKKARSKMFPGSIYEKPIEKFIGDLSVPDDVEQVESPTPEPKRPAQEAYHRNGNQPAQLPEVRAVAAKIEAKSTNENPFIDSSVGATTPQQKLSNLIDALFAKEGDDKVIGVAGWLAAIFSDGTTNSVNQLSDEEAQAAHMYMEAKADEAKLRYHIFTLYPASRDFESWYAGFVCEAKKIEAVPISKMKPELLKAMLSRLIEREADLKLRFEASKPPVEA